MDAFGIRHARGTRYRQCRDCMAARKWAARNPELHNASQRRWADANRDRIREIWRNCANAKRLRDPSSRIHGRISNQIWQVIKRGKACRSAFDLVGYTRQELVAHLERQFTKGMSWGNMGEWHVDHIVPLSSFSISGPDDPELRRAWALSNLRPLWAELNLKKGAKMECIL